MEGFEMFCERCGTRYGSDETARMAAPFARRLLEAVGVVESAPRNAGKEPFLRFCLGCRGYSCPACWNEDAGFCQTCVPTPEVEVAQFALPELLPAAREPEMIGLEMVAAAELEVAAAAEPEPVYEMVAAPEPEPEMVAAPVAEPAMIAAAMPELEPVALPEPEMVAAAMPELELVALPEPEMVAASVPELELVALPEPEMVAAPEPEPAPEMVAAPEPEPAPEMVAAPVAEPEMVAAPEPEPAPEMVAAPEPEPAPEITFADMSFSEPEPDLQWDWVLALDSEPAGVPVAAEQDVPSEPIMPPALIELPPRPSPVVFRPLELTGTILPPPPPPPALAPRIEFDLPSAPPAFVIARQPDVNAMRPVVPVGMFDSPAPQVRPCPTCELPVSARARFCRRCGSAQG
jgi:hypothetical protein